MTRNGNKPKATGAQTHAPQAPSSPPSEQLDVASSRASRVTKTAAVIALLQRPEGATLDQIVDATGWQRHSARGALAGAIRRKLGAPVSSEVLDGQRRYRAPKAGA